MATPTLPRQQFIFIQVVLLLLSIHHQSISTQELDDVIVSQPNGGGSDSSSSVAESSREAAQQESLKRPERLTVLAPKYLRPQKDYHVLVNLANSNVPATIDLQLTGARDSNVEQTEAKSILLTNSSETQTVKFSIGDWPPAEYLLSVTAQAIDRSWNFTQDTQLIYQAKSFSGFIQTDKAIYKPGQTVQFRVLCVSSSLEPIQMKNEINVTITDPARNLIRQWLSLSNYRGLLTLELPLSEDPMIGDYSIRVSARNQQIDKSFQVAEYILPTFDVKIQLPSYATYNDSDIFATVKAQYTYGKPVQGHVTLTVQPLVRFSQINTKPLNQAQFRSRLNKKGEAEFQLDVVKDLKQQRELFEREIEFFALVEEDLTGRKYNRTQTMKIFDKNVKIESLNPSETFKPGLSHLVQLRVAYQDESPVEDNGPELQLKYGPRGTKLETVRLRPVAGYVEHRFEVPSKVPLYQLDDEQARQNNYSNRSATADENLFPPNAVELQVIYRNQVHYLNDIQPFASQSQQYLQITLPQLSALSAASRKRGPRAANINDVLRVHVRATEPMQQVVCQGLAKGEIIWVSSPNGRNKTELEFEITVEQRMAPEATIMCFYVRPENKELIGDSTGLLVNGLMRNFVKLSPSREEAKPGQELEVSVFTKPNSLVGILGIDQSVLLLKSGNDLDQKQVNEELKSYGSTRDRGHAFNRNTDDLISSADMIVLTNNLVYSGLGWRAGRLLYFDGEAPHLMMASFKMAAPARSSKIVLNNLLDSEPRNPPEFHLKTALDSNQPPVIRSFFPETWLWQNGTTGAQGQVSFKAKIPDSITSWQLSAFSMNEAHGLGLSPSDKPTTVRVFRPFFLKLNLPYSIIRGETVNIQVIVFNYSKRPTKARVTMENRLGEFDFVEAANSIDDERRTNGTSESRLIEVPAEDGQSVSFLIQPKKLGQIELRVIGQGELGMGDAVVRKLLVKPEGQTQHFNKAMLLNLNEKGAKFRRNVTIEVPANAVPDSQKVFVSAMGDILGTGLTNVDDLLRLPYGCGEQNMINLVPNIVLMNYLSTSGRLRENQRAKALKNIEVGYQRQLNYLRSDGSFSAFGESDQTGSVWLTAYVLKSFQQAKAVLPNTIDDRVIRRAADYLISHARDDGSFEEVGMLHNKALASAAAGESSSGQSSVYLTAYSLIALLQRPLGQLQNKPDDSLKLPLEQVIERGINYLGQRLESPASKQSAYELAIVTYTLHLIPQTNRSQELADSAYDQLWSRAKSSGDDHEDRPRADNRADYIWWSNESSSPKRDREEPTPAFNEEVETTSVERTSTDRSGKLTAGNKTMPVPLKPLPVEKKTKQSAHLYTPESLDVEMTSLALLSTVKRGDLERALPIVRWLISKQNSQGGFASTQDTVLAIEALAAFASAAAAGQQQQQSKSIDIEFVYPRTASSSSSSNFRRTSVDQMLVNQANSLVQQQLRLPDQIGWVQIEATGTGLAVVQVSWQYNLLVSAERPAFYLNPILDKTSNINYLQLSVCTYYKGADESGQSESSSNMAVAEVELPSGYVADVETLASQTRLEHIKRVDTVAGQTKVLVYLNQVTRDEICFTVPAHRSSKVSNNKPVPVTIYDYYDRKKAARIFYALPQTVSSCDICESESCSDQCSSKPARQSDRAPSLHEQRRLRLRDNVEPSDKNARLSLSKPTNGTSTVVRNTANSVDLIPLAPFYLTLVSAFRNLYQQH